MYDYHRFLEDSPDRVFRFDEYDQIQFLILVRELDLPYDESIYLLGVSVHSFAIHIPSVNKISNGYNYHGDYQRTEKVYDNSCDYDEDCYYCYIRQL